MHYYLTCTQTDRTCKKENNTRKYIAMQYSEVTYVMVHNQHVTVFSRERKKSK